MNQAEDDIIESIAHAAVDADLWIQVLEQISCNFAGTKIVMHSEDSSVKHNIGLIHFGTNKRLMHDYTTYFASINAWAPIFARMPKLVTATTDELLPTKAIVASEFYNDFVLREGSFNHATGVKIFHERSRLTMLSVHYGDARADRYNTLLKHVLQTLTPHIRTALEVNRRIASQDGVAKSISDIIRCARSPMCLLDARAKLVLANQLFLDELASGVVMFGLADAVTPRAPELGPAFDRLIRHATSPRASGPTAPTDAFEMTFAADGSSPVKAAVLGMTPYSRAGLPWLSNQRTYALVSLERVPVPVAPAPSALMARFGLTPAEARLAVRLSTGQALSDCADQSGITFQTARTYLRNIFAKTDTHHQGQLIAKLLKGCSDHVLAGSRNREPRPAPVCARRCRASP